MSDRHLSVLVRQLALHCNLASQIQRTLGSGRDPYSSNWLERLRQLKRIREKLVAQGEAGAGPGTGPGAAAAQQGEVRKVTAHNDFTGMVLRRAAGKKDE